MPLQIGDCGSRIEKLLAHVQNLCGFQPSPVRPERSVSEVEGRTAQHAQISDMSQTLSFGNPQSTIESPLTLSLSRKGRGDPY